MAQLPARIGAYEIQARLGQGGMAETYVGLRRGPGGFAQRVCIKRIRQDAADDPELVRQFLAEAAVIARLRHTAITQVLDFGRDGVDYYLALELIEGVDLRKLLDRHPSGIAPELVHYIASELATALDFAHRAGGDAGASAIVHRDVSSSNVLLSREGEVKLSDFGIARPLDAPQHTRTGIVKGKVPYLAPEYARSGRFDPRCDLFSLGVVLYECLSGLRPHDGATELETLERAARGQRTSLRELASKAPDGLIAQVECLLEADPELRTQSAAQVLEDLSAIPAGSRARRELGALVVAACEAANGARLATPTGGVPVGPTERWNRASDGDNGAGGRTLDADQAAVLASGSRMRIGRGPLAALSVALALAVVVIALAVRHNMLTSAAAASAAAPGATTIVEAQREPIAPPGSAGTAVPADPTTLANSQTPTKPGTREDQAANSAATPSQASSAAHSARLEVIVMPYGDVSVDGHELGRAPINVALPVGEHAIRARNRDGTIARQITLHEGEHRQVVLR